MSGGIFFGSSKIKKKRSTRRLLLFHRPSRLREAIVADAGSHIFRLLSLKNTARQPVFYSFFLQGKRDPSQLPVLGNFRRILNATWPIAKLSSSSPISFKCKSDRSCQFLKISAVYTMQQDRRSHLLRQSPSKVGCGASCRSRIYRLHTSKKTARLTVFCNSILPLKNIRVTPDAGWQIYGLKTVTCPSSSTPSFFKRHRLLGE